MVHETDESREWRDKTIAYAQAINDFVERGMRDGWDLAGSEPEDPGREHLAETAIEAVREANRTGNRERLRDVWPPAHLPLIPLLEENGQSIPTLCLLKDGTILARIGAPYEDGHVVRISGTTVDPVPEVKFFGRCPNRRYFAVAQPDGVLVTDGWEGKEVCRCPWPTGLEDVPEGFEINPFETAPVPTRLIPFPDGDRVLLVSSDGIFVLTPAGARRLYPSREQMREHFTWLQKEYPEDELSLDVSMEHGAVSQDGRWIAVGGQDSSHLIFDAGLNLAGDVGHLSEYPHYALFSGDNEMVAFNSCHFYNGVTIGVPLDLLPGLETESYEEDDRFPILEGQARVYAGVWREEEFIVGDAGGYVRAFGKDGAQHWQYFIGSSIGDIDVSPDGKTLLVSTYAGFLSTIDLDAGDPEPYEIGTGHHCERHRWLFWKNEQQPLLW